jgi:hypothetical protein
MSYLTIICTISTLMLTILNIWKGVNHPVKDLEKRVETIEEKIQRLDQKSERDWQAFQEQEKVNSMLLKSQWAIMSHLLDGNHTKDLEECKNEAAELLFKKGGKF